MGPASNMDPHHVKVVSVDTILGAGNDYIVVRASNLFYATTPALIAATVKSGYVLENEGDLTAPTVRTEDRLDELAKLDPSVHILPDPTLGARARRLPRTKRHQFYGKI